MTMALLLFPGNPNKIDSWIWFSSLMLKPVIDSHHFAQLFQRNLLQLQSMRKGDNESTLLQNVLSTFICQYWVTCG